MSERVVVFACCMLALTARGGSQSNRQQAARAEAQDLVDAVLKGEGNLNAHINRVKYLGQEAVVSLELAEMARRAGDEQQLRRVAQTLAALAHPNGEAALLYLTGSGDAVARMYAAQGLGRLRSAGAGPRLLPLLQDKSMGVRREAAKALGQVRYARAGPALIKAAALEAELEVKVELLVAAGASGDKRQAGALAALLDDPSDATRLAAAQGLCLLGHKKGVEFAKKKLASAEPYERLEGLQLFEGARGKEAAQALAPLLEDKDRAVAARAARILYQGGDPKMLDWLVLRSFEAVGDAKLPFEKELETLRLADDQRKAILARAGIR